jgi:hypothetical protein
MRITAWQRLTGSAVISNVVDGTDEDMLWNVRSECEEDEGTDCED